MSPTLIVAGVILFITIGGVILVAISDFITGEE
jgi:hypothetical protein